MTKKVFTRKDYLDKKCTHAELYGGMVTESMIRRVVDFIGHDRLLGTPEDDEHLSSIPLKTWDRVYGFDESGRMGTRNLVHHPMMDRETMKENGLTNSASENCCLAKAAAREYINRVRNKDKK